MSKINSNFNGTTVLMELQKPANNSRALKLISSDLKHLATAPRWLYGLEHARNFTPAHPLLNKNSLFTALFRPSERLAPTKGRRGLKPSLIIIRQWRPYCSSRWPSGMEYSSDTGGARKPDHLRI